MTKMPAVFHKQSLDPEWLNVSRPYLFFGHGTGDTFNACLALKSMRLDSDLRIEAIIPAYQLPLFLFVCECLELPLHAVYCLDFFDHSFVNALAMRHPEFKFTFGFPPPIRSPGVHVCWKEPSAYPERFRLADRDIIRFCSRVGISATNSAARLERPTAILFTSMSLNIRLPGNFWKMLVSGLRERGFDVRVNNSGNANYGHEAVDDAPSLQLSHPELLQLVYTNPSQATLIGLRSGMFDLLRLSQCQGIVFYPSTPAWMWSSCRLEHVGYSRLHAQEVLLPPRFEVGDDYFRGMLDALVV